MLINDIIAVDLTLTYFHLDFVLIQIKFMSYIKCRYVQYHFKNDG